MADVERRKLTPVKDQGPKDGRDMLAWFHHMEQEYHVDETRSSVPMLDEYGLAELQKAINYAKTDEGFEHTNHYLLSHYGLCLSGVDACYALEYHQLVSFLKYVQSLKKEGAFDRNCAEGTNQVAMEARVDFAGFERGLEQNLWHNAQLDRVRAVGGRDVLAMTRRGMNVNKMKLEMMCKRAMTNPEGKKRKLVLVSDTK